MAVNKKRWQQRRFHQDGLFSTYGLSKSDRRRDKERGVGNVAIIESIGARTGTYPKSVANELLAAERNALRAARGKARRRKK